MVQLPYLQPFDDVNKRVSRLAANIPLIKTNLAPLSFTDVPVKTYREAMLGVYELKRIDLLKDVFIWAYERSASRYAAVRQSLGDPDPISAGTAGDAALWGGSIAATGMAANPLGARQAGRVFADHMSGLLVGHGMGGCVWSIAMRGPGAPAARKHSKGRLPDNQANAHGSATWKRHQRYKAAIELSVSAAFSLTAFIPSGVDNDLFHGSGFAPRVGAARSAMRGIGQASRRPPRGKGAPQKAVKQGIINAAWY